MNKTKNKENFTFRNYPTKGYIRDELMDLSEIQSLLNIPRRTLFRLIKAPNFPRRYRISARTSLWNKKDIMAWIKAREEQ